MTIVKVRTMSHSGHNYMIPYGTIWYVKINFLVDLTKTGTVRAAPRMK